MYDRVDENRMSTKNDDKLRIVSEWRKIIDDLQNDIAFEQQGKEICIAVPLSINDKIKRYTVLVTQSEILVAAFKKIVHASEATVIDDRSVLRRVKTDGEYHDQTPLMISTGGFISMYYHFIFGLFFNRILKDISHPNVEFSVFCQGRGYRAGDMWWLSDNPLDYNVPYWHTHIVELCLNSPDFQNMKDPNDLAVGKHMRTVVWMCRSGHAFALGWDLEKNQDLVSGHFFYIDCNHDNPFALDILRIFMKRLREKFKITGDLSLNNYSIVSREEVDATPEFSCVPFMVRSTLYISLIEKISDISLLIDVMKENGEAETSLSLKIYNRYEELLLEKVEHVVGEKNLLLLPSYFAEHPFVNINSICLMSYNSINGKVTGKYYFQGFIHGFVKIKEVDLPLTKSDCITSSKFPSLETSLILSTVRECRLIIDRNLLKKRNSTLHE